MENFIFCAVAVVAKSTTYLLHSKQKFNIFESLVYIQKIEVSPQKARFGNPSIRLHFEIRE